MDQKNEKDINMYQNTIKKGFRGLDIRYFIKDDINQHFNLFMYLFILIFIYKLILLICKSIYGYIPVYIFLLF